MYLKTGLYINTGFFYSFTFMKLYNRHPVVAADELKDRISLQSPTYSENDRGKTTVTFAEYAEVWCQCLPGKGARALQDAQVVFDSVCTFRIRHGSGIKEDWQLVFEGRTFVIHSINDIRNRFQYDEIIAYTKDL